jgi:hypothetical protein
MTGAYERLRELTRLQTELIGDGRLVEAIAIGERWDALAASLPEQPPAEALPLLEEAFALTAANATALAGYASALVQDVQHVQRGRQAIASYASSGV